MCFAPQRCAIFHLSSGQMAPRPPLSSSLTLPTSAFQSVHIVGSLTSKLPSIICLWYYEGVLLGISMPSLPDQKKIFQIQKRTNPSSRCRIKKYSRLNKSFSRTKTYLCHQYFSWSYWFIFYQEKTYFDTSLYFDPLWVLVIFHIFSIVSPVILGFLVVLVILPVFHRLSPSFTIFHHLSPSFTIFHHLSPSFTIFHHLSPHLAISFENKTFLAISFSWSLLAFENNPELLAVSPPAMSNQLEMLQDAAS